jgi:hypothetical protein
MEASHDLTALLLGSGAGGTSAGVLSPPSVETAPTMSRAPLEAAAFVGD